LDASVPESTHESIHKLNPEFIQETVLDGHAIINPNQRPVQAEFWLYEDFQASFTLHKKASASLAEAF
jgi:hypothetical protein